jgi:hypothetical protein
MKITAVSAVTSRAIQPVRPLDDVQQRTASRQTTAPVVARSASFATPFGMPGALTSGLTRAMTSLRPRNAAVPRTAFNRRAQVQSMADESAASHDGTFINLNTLPDWYAPEKTAPTISNAKYLGKELIHFGGDFVCKPEDFCNRTIPEIMREHTLTPQHLDIAEIAMTQYGDAAKLLDILPMVEVMKVLGYTTNVGVRSLCVLAEVRELQIEKRKSQIEYLRQTTGVNKSKVLTIHKKPARNPLDSRPVRLAIEQGQSLAQIASNARLGCTSASDLIAIHKVMEARKKQEREDRKRGLN